MRFTKIAGILINLETVTEIKKVSSNRCDIYVTYVNGSFTALNFEDGELRDAEFDRLEQLIYDIQ